ncbi:MAG: cysteine synthase family protein [Flavobacteriaceae bacterium]|jgi:cysteine synthase A|nr:cysteine synthase family protein [Flavobacteriaceae bacterium]MDG1687260.1 cysteine synthase family protein [Flavobacteriaceae bacterium]MDG2235726.1 cysteine synthase family protein [Flavobacteriaceae bacterium]|tara:strand:+ start:4242 stop:5171 length:930 start_codon:yes stop_codon:yes gene_type:complete
MKNILEIIGNTPIVKLQKIVSRGCGEIYLKLEAYNPTGSKKDRMALAMIEGAEKRGDLKKGMTVVEYSGGSTGAGLAFVCSLKGYRFRLITADVFGKEKISLMNSLGADLEVIKSRDGKITKELINKMINRAKEISKEPNTFFTNQLDNEDVIKGFVPLGEEILDQINGSIDAVCDTVGTAGTLMGIAKAFKNANSNSKIIAVEPSSSPILSEGIKGSHNVEGVGLGFIPKIYDSKLVDDVITIEESIARQTSRDLALKEGIFCGTSSGMNVAAAIQISQKLGPKSRVVAISCDTGLKYLSEGLFDKKN